MSSNGQLDCSRGRPDSEVDRGPVSRNEQNFPVNPSLRRRARQPPLAVAGQAHRVQRPPSCPSCPSMSIPRYTRACR